ncbi:hypothetical protein ACF08N_28225 [Streptomyces sp. NPDC015127]|uniref:hypothetical protein n=1 Tax=Streptomyces sp. NPDC015127 TaxID=3364939 RepID=UPI0036FBE4D0
MDGPGLSHRERAILAGIERDLRADEGLDRRLRTMRPGPPLTEAPSLLRGHFLGTGTCLAGAVTAVLLVMAASSSSPGLIWAFAGSWVLTLTGLGLLVCRWSQRFAAGHHGTDRPADEGKGDDGMGGAR